MVARLFGIRRTPLLLVLLAGLLLVCVLLRSGDQNPTSPERPVSLNASVSVEPAAELSTGDSMATDGTVDRDQRHAPSLEGAPTEPLFDPRASLALRDQWVQEYGESDAAAREEVLNQVCAALAGNDDTRQFAALTALWRLKLRGAPVTKDRFRDLLTPLLRSELAEVRRLCPRVLSELGLVDEYRPDVLALAHDPAAIVRASSVSFVKMLAHAECLSPDEEEVVLYVLNDRERQVVIDNVRAMTNLPYSNLVESRLIQIVQNSEDSEVVQVALLNGLCGVSKISLAACQELIRHLDGPDPSVGVDIMRRLLRCEAPEARGRLSEVFVGRLDEARFRELVEGMLSYLARWGELRILGDLDRVASRTQNEDLRARLILTAQEIRSRVDGESSGD